MKLLIISIVLIILVIIISMLTDCRENFVGPIWWITRKDTSRREAPPLWGGTSQCISPSDCTGEYSLIKPKDNFVMNTRPCNMPSIYFTSTYNPPVYNICKLL
jgi:hypothetical protein